jgi:hypothetical protein
MAIKTLIDIDEVSRRLCRAVGSLYNDVSKGRRGIGLMAGGEGRLFHKIGRSVRFDWEAIEEKLLGDRTMGSGQFKR